MQKNKFILIISNCLFLLALSACVKEQNYRGVPERQWEHLSGEQRQLIVDKAYQDELAEQAKVD